MRVEQSISTAGRWGLDACIEPGESSPIVARCNVDATPRRLSADRFSIAAYLLFGRWATRGFSVAPGTGQETRAAIDSDSTGGAPVRDVLRMPTAELGSRIGVLAEYPDMSALQNPLGIVVARSDEWNGAMRSTSGLVTATNAFLLSGSDDDLRPLLGIGVLFAADLLLDGLELRVPRGRRLRDAESARCANLLASCGLSLTFSDPAR